MPTRDKAFKSLDRLFTRQPVADLKTLKKILGTDSRTTVFRVLTKKGYLTSYSHAGRYYTLRKIPEFDDNGLWVYGDKCFSRHGSLRSTIIYFVDNSIAGQTHMELQQRLHLRVHDTLHDLVMTGHIGRVEIKRLYLYVSADTAVAETQIKERHRLLLAEPPEVALPSPSVVIEILLAFIHHPGNDSNELASHLRRQGLEVSSKEIETVFAKYELGKKKHVLRHFRR